MSKWTEEFSLNRSLRVLKGLALRHCDLAGLHGQRIASLIRKEKWDEIVSYELPVREGLIPVGHLLHARQALAFFTKFEQLPLNVDKEHVAYQKFCQAEASCKRINQIFSLASKGDVSLCPDYVRQLERARHWIHNVLGPVPNFSALRLCFGPGATTATKKKDSCPSNKFGDGMSCSGKLYSSGRLPELLRELPSWLSAYESDAYVTEDGWWATCVPVDIHNGLLSFVPKNAKTYRAIVTEPVLNSILQHGIGREIAARLRRVGIDIKDQSRNQWLAQRGSLTFEFTDSDATLDLTSASDCISRELVRRLLPASWFALCDLARTSVVEYNGSEIALEKFSSMGNGFTFPLETLIFVALSRAAVPQRYAGRVVSYGDDIIAPSCCANDVIRCLQRSGFEVNTEKSYTEGPFRESCGKDYYFGFNVRPFYQKELVSYRSLFVLHNYFFRLYGDSVEWTRMVLDLIPEHLRLYGPDGYGDGHLLSKQWTPRRHRKHASHGWDGAVFDTFSLKPVVIKTRYPGDFVSPLYSIYVEEDRPDFILNDPSNGTDFAPCGRPLWTTPGTSGYRRTSIYVLS